MKRPLHAILSLALLSITACSGGIADGTGDPGPGQDDPEPVPSMLTLVPSDVTLQVRDGVAVEQVFAATLTTGAGEVLDVSDRVRFTLQDSGFGRFEGPTLRVAGAAAGTTSIRASVDGAFATASLRVEVSSRRVDGSAPADAAGLFVGAEDPAAAPAIVYPAEGVLVPRNLGDLEVHWTDGAGHDVFEVALTGDGVDLRVYTGGGATGWASFAPSEWALAARNAGRVELAVRAVRRADPSVIGASARRAVDLTSDDLAGGLYYWASATTGGAPVGIYRHDAGAPGQPAERFFTTAESPDRRCVACHALSRDGSRMAVTYDGGNRSAAIVDVASQTPLVGAEREYWNFASFWPDASKLVTSRDGVLTIRDGATAAAIATVATGGQARQADVHPDGTALVYVRSSGMQDWAVAGGDLVTQTYDPGTGELGDPVPQVTDGGNNYYPSWSPDGEWILFNRSTESSYDARSAELWVVKADGGLPPIKLDAANLGAGLTNSWARWAPFVGQKDGEPLYWLTFSSKRDFGVRLVGTRRPQLWMAPFFPDRAADGADPTRPAFRLPFQELSSNNHIAQWTERVIPVE
jgi:hypothetical protein